MQRDFLIIGGGVVGMAVAYGLLRAGQRVTLLDGSDDALRASRGNAGLTWVQGKGTGMPRYAELSFDASLAWPAFARELRERTGIDLEYECRGGVDLCFDADEAKARKRDYALVQQASPYLARRFQWEYLDRHALAPFLPGLGERVHGGTWSPHDGHCNPLYLLRALFTATHRLGLDYRPGSEVQRLVPLANGFRAETTKGAFEAERVVVAAGLGSASLAPMVGLSGAVRPVRGQVLITERMPRRELLPTPQIRQTASGGYLIGDTQEEVGCDRGVTNDVMLRLAERAVRIFPFLAQAQVVRAWGALRVMTTDGNPLYEAAQVCPGAYGVSSHSGISLAALHAGPLADSILNDRLGEEFGEFSRRDYLAPP
ncbi:MULTISPECIES: FAD-binding oxidoreductase [Halomonadaceae]|uniref:NAD(P)/FAD-dependent oxidoreductase n=1 Tax=Halomonadaceae TaxID=28256 RepID=UPI001597E03B|nr:MULTISPECIES: FAD-binding oxidoreductase [Halomonas]QJQ95875.1 FAD-binding oxidoreductase [Halomonas sp. PA5]